MPLIPSTLANEGSSAGRPLVKATYDLQHWTPGPTGTCLSQPLTLLIESTKTTATLVVEHCEGATPDEALTRMSAWLRRLADGLDQRAPSVQLPV